MNIKLEIEKYNYYRLLGESYEPKSVDFALSKNMKYIIIENVLFDLEKNKSLGVYYKNSLIIEQTDYKPGDVSGESEWPWEDWSAEDWIDLGVAGVSAALDISGVGTGVAKAIDIVHGLSFIYRGISRNNDTYTLIGLLSIISTTIPAVGGTLKGVIIGLSKTTVGRSTKALMQYLKGNKLFMDTIPPIMNKLMGKLKSIKSWIDNLATKYTWVDDVWSKVKSSWNGVVKWFEDFMGKLKSYTDPNKRSSVGLSTAMKTKNPTIIGSKIASSIDKVGIKIGNVMKSKVLEIIPLGPNAFKPFIRLIDDTYAKGNTLKNGVWAVVYYYLITEVLETINEGLCLFGIKSDEYKETLNNWDSIPEEEKRKRFEKVDAQYDDINNFINIINTTIKDIPFAGDLYNLAFLQVPCSEILGKSAGTEILNWIKKTTIGEDILNSKEFKDAEENINKLIPKTKMRSKKID